MRGEVTIVDKGLPEAIEVAGDLVAIVLQIIGIMLAWPWFSLWATLETWPPC